jgi:hypothetical protein
MCWIAHHRDRLEEVDMRTKVILALTLFAVALAARTWAQPGQGQAQRSGKVSPFVGYWMGVDPVDGGDARRSLIQQADGTFHLAARDSFFSLCDNTDHGYGSFDDGTLVSRDVLQSNNLTLECFNNGATVTLHVRFELKSDNLMFEIATRADGTPVSTIVFHKVSAP